MKSMNYATSTARQRTEEGQRGILPSKTVLDQLVAEQCLKEYTKQAWNVLLPKKPLVWNWHLDILCEHYMAITNGEIHYLIVNMPPRMTKSMLLTVFWPTWEWGPANRPENRFVTSSYSQQLSTRDSSQSRQLLLSEWYQSRWGNKFTILDTQNQKIRYNNDAGGYRIATSVKGMGTGEGGDRVIADDPNNITEVESPAVRMSTNLWWDESMSTRLDDERVGAFVVNQQRTNTHDLTGHILEKFQKNNVTDFVHIILPMRFEKKYYMVCRTPLEFKDPRTVEGESLDLVRFPEELLQRREGRMTAYAIAAQHQQRPAPRGGGFFKVDCFKLWKELPPGLRVVKSVRYWDKAVTEGGGANTSGVLMHKVEIREKKQKPIELALITDCVTFQHETERREKRIRQVAHMDGPDVAIVIEQEPGSSGKDAIYYAQIDPELKGYHIKGDRVTGPKEVRAESYADSVELGTVAILIGNDYDKNKRHILPPWVGPFLEEHENFGPAAGYKDRVDASSGAFRELFIDQTKNKRAGTF